MSTPPGRRPPEELARIIDGGLTNATLERLADLRASGGATAFGSVTELDSLRELGLRPLGQVVGLSICRPLMGVIKTTAPGQGRRRATEARHLERSGPVAARDQARRRALGRLEQQAVQLGADIVYGVVSRQRRRTSAAGEPDIEHAFTGTAATGGRAPRSRRPVLTLCGPPEILTLHRAGADPIGIVGANAFVETWPSRETIEAARAMSRSRGNRPLADYAHGVYEARRLAADRLRDEVRALGADGVIGIVVESERHLGEVALRTSMQLLGTAIRRRPRAGRSPRPVVDLRGRR